MVDLSMTITGEGGLLHIKFGNPNALGGSDSEIQLSGTSPILLCGDPYLDELTAFHQAINTRLVKANDAQAGAVDVVTAWNILEKEINNEKTEANHEKS
jgi:hypothetical protein